MISLRYSYRITSECDSEQGLRVFPQAVDDATLRLVVSSGSQSWPKNWPESWLVERQYGRPTEREIAANEAKLDSDDHLGRSVVSRLW